MIKKDKTYIEIEKLKLSDDIKDKLSDLIITLLIDYPKIKRKEIIKELYNEVYFLNRYEQEIFKNV